MNSYFEIINQVATAFPVLMILLTLVFLVYEYKNEGTVSISKNLVLTSFCFYILCCYALTILPLPTYEEVLSFEGPYTDFRLFGFVSDFFYYTDGLGLIEKLTSSWFYLPFFNFLMLVPFGIYQKKFFGNGFGVTLFWAFVLSLSFELLQWSGLFFIYPNPYRLCQLDDLILNVAGALTGYALVSKKEKADLPVRQKSRISFKDRVLSILIDLVALSLISRLLFWLIAPEDSLSRYVLFAASVVIYTLITIKEGRRLSGFLTGQVFTSKAGKKPKPVPVLVREGLLFLFVLPAPVLGFYLIGSEDPYRILFGFVFLIVFVLTLVQSLVSVPFYESLTGTYLTDLTSQRAWLSSSARARRGAQRVPPKTSHPRVRTQALESRERK